MHLSFLTLQYINVIEYQKGNKKVESRETGNIEYTRRRQTNQKHNTLYKNKHKYHGTQNVKTHNRTTQKTKKMGNTDPNKKNPRVNACAREGKTVPASFKTPIVLVIYSQVR